MKMLTTMHRDALERVRCAQLTQEVAYLKVLEEGAEKDPDGNTPLPA